MMNEDKELMEALDNLSYAAWSGNPLTVSELDRVMSIIRNNLNTPQDVPLGAIHNAEAFMQRLERDYDFECQAGPLHMCTDWIELKQCFEAIKQYSMI